MKEIIIFNNHFYLDKTGAIFWKEKDVVKRQVETLTYDQAKNLIKKANEIELLVKKNPQFSINITTDFIISHTT